ncbi:hypothetical protein LPJ53_004441 [Coemansia erecta]|uniref:NmrA-like domain-containing protein n=1 Tax=Coemansia erecta TaxID=147472 RepID=A0A9W8CPT3_9FUNG|nr:hypothetical protein LPJ53_004441 [Coemansia erecta]
MQSFSDIIQASETKCILVTGCDMYTGFMVARELLKEKGKHFKHVCAGYYKENHLVHMLKKAGADTCELTVDKPEHIVDMYRKVDIVVVVPPVSEHRWGDSSVAYVLAAKEANVKGLVLCSKINSKELSEMNMLAPLYKMEEAYERVKSSMKAASLVRCSLHIDMLWLFRRQIAAKQKICLPISTEAKCAPLAEADGARALCNMLLHSKYKPGVYELTGPEKLSFEEIAHEASSAIGVEIGYEHIDSKQMEEYLKQHHEICDNQIMFICDLFKAISKDMLSKKTDDLKKMLDGSPHTVKSFLKKNASDFKPHD